MRLNWRDYTGDGPKTGADTMKDLWAIDLQLFSEPNAGGKNGGEGPDAEGNVGGAGDTDSGKPLFTPEQQEVLNRIVGERVSRAERAAIQRAREQAAKDAGFASVEEYEEAVKAWVKQREDAKTELQREKEARAKAEATARQAVENAKRATLKAAFALEAAGRVVSVADAFRLVEDELMKLEVGEDGSVDGVKEIVDELVKARPWLAPQVVGGSSGGGNPPRGSGPKDEGPERARTKARERLGVGGGTSASVDELAAAIARLLKDQQAKD